MQDRGRERMRGAVTREGTVVTRGVEEYIQTDRRKEAEAFVRDLSFLWVLHTTDGRQRRPSKNEDERARAVLLPPLPRT